MMKNRQVSTCLPVAPTYSDSADGSPVRNHRQLTSGKSPNLASTTDHREASSVITPVNNPRDDWDVNDSGQGRSVAISDRLQTIPISPGHRSCIIDSRDRCHLDDKLVNKDSSVMDVGNVSDINCHELTTDGKQAASHSPKSMRDNTQLSCAVTANSRETNIHSPRYAKDFKSSTEVTFLGTIGGTQTSLSSNREKQGSSRGNNYVASTGKLLTPASCQVNLSNLDKATENKEISHRAGSPWDTSSFHDGKQAVADDPTANLVGMLFEICRQTLKAVNDTRADIKLIQEDMDRLKAALVGQLPQENQEEIFHLECHGRADMFEEFCSQLASTGFRQIVVKSLTSTYGQKNIGELVRRVLKAAMTDELQLLYNRTGTHGKKKFPKDFEKCIYNCAKFFNKKEEISVKRGGIEMATTVRMEVGKQVEIFLSNAATRMKRAAKN